MKTENRKYVKAALNLLLAVVVLLLAILLLPKLLMFFLPFVIGALIAAIASPMVKFLEEKLKIKRKAGTVFVIVAVIGLVALIIYLIADILIREGIGFVDQLPELWKRLEGDVELAGSWMGSTFKNLPFKSKLSPAQIGEYMDGLLSDIISGITTPAINSASSMAKQIPTVIIGVIFCLISAYFFVADKKHLSEIWRKNMPEAIIRRADMVKRSLSISIGGYIRAQIIIEFWIFLILAAGLIILGAEYVWIIAFGIAILDLLPILGTGTALVPWSVVAFIRSDIKMGVGLLVLWGVSQLVRQLIQPKIVGDSVGLSTFATLILLYVGFMIKGVLGMLLAIPIGIVIYTMYQEGIFDTTINSAKILTNGINNFRRLSKEDMAEIDKDKEDD